MRNPPAMNECALSHWLKIGRTLNIDRWTCERIYKRWKQGGTPSTRRRSGRSTTFGADERARLEAFVTRDTRIRRLSREAIAQRWATRVLLVLKRVIHEMGYHRRVPRNKFHVSPENKPKRVVWCQERLHWAKKEWERVIWTRIFRLNSRLWAPTLGYPQSRRGVSSRLRRQKLPLRP